MDSLLQLGGWLALMLRIRVKIRVKIRLLDRMDFRISLVNRNLSYLWALEFLGTLVLVMVTELLVQTQESILHKYQIYLMHKRKLR
jgi:predicted membrane-bound mannosyltransferase